MLSSKHILLFQHAISQFSLPSCVFVNQSIAFGMSYGFFTHMDSQLQQDKYALVLNLGDVVFSISLMSFNAKTLTMHYETCTSSIGGREFTFAFKEYILNTCQDERIRDPQIFSQLQNALTNARHSLCSFNLPSTDIVVDELFEDEDFEFSATQSGFFGYCEKLGLFQRFTESLQPMLQVSFFL